MTKDEFLLYIIRSLILEYRLSLETVCKLFNKNPDDLYKKLFQQIIFNLIMH